MKRSFGGTASRNLPLPLRVEWSKRANSDLRKLGKQDKARVSRAVQRFADTGHGATKKLGGLDPPRFRLKVGTWRVMFRHETGAIHVHRVLRRRDSYRKSSWIGQEVPEQVDLNEAREHEGSPDPNRIDEPSEPPLPESRRAGLRAYRALKGQLNRRCLQRGVAGQGARMRPVPPSHGISSALAASL